MYQSSLFLKLTHLFLPCNTEFLWVNKFNHCFHCLPYQMDIHFGTLIINTLSLYPSNIIIIFLFYFELGLVKSSTNIKNNYFYKKYNICNLFTSTLFMLLHYINNFVYSQYTIFNNYIFIFRPNYNHQNYNITLTFWGVPCTHSKS